MLTFKKYNFFNKINIIFFYVLFLFCITSCSLKIEKNNNFLVDKKNNQIKKLIIPKGTHFPPNNQEYYIPYTNTDLNKKYYDILPPVK